MLDCRRHATVLPFVWSGALAVLTACGGGGGGGGATLPPGAAPGATPTTKPTTAPNGSPTSTPAPAGETLVVAGQSAGQAAFYTVGAAQPRAVYPPPPPAGQQPQPFSPRAVAADGSGNVFVMDQQANNVTEFAPPYTGSPVTQTLPSGTLKPISIAVTAQGQLFVAIEDPFASLGVTQAVQLLLPPYTSNANLPIPSGINFAPYCLTLDGQGHLFVTNAAQYNGDPGTLEYGAPYTAAPATFAFGGSANAGFSQGANCATDTSTGELFIGYASTVQAYAPPYTGAAAVIPEGAPGGGMLAVSSANHDLFVANGTTVDVYAPPYTSKAATVSNGVNQPNVVTVDPTGNLFVASTYNGTVTEYAPPYTGAPVWTVNAFSLGSSSALTVVP